MSSEGSVMDDAWRRAVGEMAHDVNNVFAIILSYTDLAIADMPKLPEGCKLQADLEEVRRAGRRGVELVRRLQAMSREGGPAAP